MELAFLTMFATACIFGYLWWQERNKPQEIEVRYKKQKQHCVNNLSDGAWDFLSHLCVQVSNKKNPRKLNLHTRVNESYETPFYTVEVFAVQNDNVVNNSWYDIDADLSEEFVEFLKWIINHLNKGGGIALINTENERRAIMTNTYGKATGEIIILESEHNFLEWSK